MKFITGTMHHTFELLPTRLSNIVGSVSCQRRDWNVHRTACRPPKVPAPIEQKVASTSNKNNDKAGGKQLWCLVCASDLSKSVPNVDFYYCEGHPDHSQCAEC